MGVNLVLRPCIMTRNMTVRTVQALWGLTMGAEEQRALYERTIKSLADDVESGKVQLATVVATGAGVFTDVDKILNARKRHRKYIELGWIKA